MVLRASMLVFGPWVGLVLLVRILGGGAPVLSPVAPTVNVAAVNAGTSVSRDLCLTIAAGSDAAYECGDLRTWHPLPGVRTMGQVRAPVLTYNSQHANPHPVVSANVTLPSGGTRPDSVVAHLAVVNANGNTTTVKGSWTGTSWSAGTTRRINLAFAAGAASTWPTGTYAYTLEVANWYGATRMPRTVTGELAIVNRSASDFGAGWWLAGLEQLHLPAADTTQRVWVGGDGSVRRYARVNATTWVAPSVTRPDTLIWDGAASRHVRLLPGGTRVRFDAGGRHVETDNRLGHRTTFSYSSGRLHRITMPTNGATAPCYQFNYDANGKIASVTSPAAGGSSCTAGTRRTTTVWNSGVRVDSIRDPDNHKVKFSYSNNRMTNRTDRRGTVTRYTVAGAGGAHRFTQVRVDTAGLRLVTSFTPAETRSLSTGAAVTALDTANVFTLLDGPRTDVTDHTRFHIDQRFGTPARIRDALGNVTTLTRGHATFPALVMRVTHPNGYREEASYDARGNVTQQVRVNPYGDNANHTTRYVYGAAGNRFLRDRVVRIVPPAGDSVMMSYASSNGNLLTREDRRGISSRTTFAYHANGLLAKVTNPDGGADSLVYNASGNVSATRDALGSWTTRHSDSLGRDTLVVSPIDNDTLWHRQRTSYTVMDRVSQIQSIGPEMRYTCTNCGGWYEQGVPVQTLTVVNTYDAEGNLTTVVRQSIPDPLATDMVQTAYEYDRAHRKTHETNFGTGTHEYTYDRAGNVASWKTRLGPTITMQYNELGQMTRRVVPEIFHAQTTCGSNGLVPVTANPIPCVSGLVFDSLRVPQDVQTFAYDDRGNLAAAHNRYARVKRTYYRGGALQTDSLRMRRNGTPYLADGGSGGGGGGGGGGDDPCHPNDPFCHVEPESIEEGWEMGTMSATALPGDPYPNTEFTTHVFGLRYTYDGNGRRTRLDHPSALGTGSKATTYGYHSWGPLQTVTGMMGESYTFAYDASGRPDTTAYPGSLTETYKHDRNGRRTNRRLGSMYNDTLTYDARGKVRTVNMRAAMREAEQWYSGLGAVVGSRWNSSISAAYEVDEHRADAHGNVYWSRKRDHFGTDPRYLHRYDPSGRIASIRFDEHTSPNTHLNNATGTNVYRAFDAAGNLQYGGELAHQQNTGEVARHTSRYYYAPDGKLRAIKKYGREHIQGTVGNDDLISEIRYDALGRRISQHTRHRPMCTTDCHHAIERYVWDGDQVLYEMRANGATGASLETQSGGGNHHGRVGYTHGPGIDAPLGLVRFGHTGVGAGGPYLVVPHTNWRGQYERGTTASGAACTTSTCGFIDWPAPKLRTYHDGYPRPKGDWMGGLIQGQRDQSGLLYRRNRYYDPSTGQFTQEDPIGLAGGLNLYGYANGDPVNFSDPFGLCPIPLSSCAGRQGFATAVGAIPVVGGAYDGVSAAIGRDLIAGESLSGVERLATATGIVLGSGRAARQGANIASDVARRPSRVRKGTVQSAWDDARPGSSGGRVCSTCSAEVQVAPGTGPRDWHVDHHGPKWKDRDLTGMNRQQVLDEFNRSTRLRCVSCNVRDNK